jgi:hypothetical protein
MKKTDLEKAKALKLMGDLHGNAAPSRFASGSSVMTRRERRSLDQQQGLIPFAVKLDEKLAERVRQLATARHITIDAMVSELLTNSLEKA